MNSARADALSARSRVADHWIARNAESFRHLPPPAAEVWLGDTAASAAACEASPLAGAGWMLQPLGDTLLGRVDARWLDANDPAQRAELFDGVAAPAGDDAAPFAWAHRALCRRGLRLRIGGGDAGADARAVWLHLRHQPRSDVEAPMLVVDLLPGARCVLVEAHEHDAQACGRAVVQNLHVHLHLGRGAELQHLRIVTPAAQDRVAHHVHAALERSAVYRQALLASGSGYHLQRSVLALRGAEASARTGAALLAGASASLEQQLRVTHGAAGTASGVEALALGGSGARVVVDAYGRIDAGADDAELRQRLGAIPTGGQPRLVLRPQLEILHDRVQAAHGATWGALPEEALFYAAQRGLGEREARALIVEGLAGAALARALEAPELLDTLGVAARLGRAVARHLGGAAREEACHG
jgi:Fe-S cluster assembly protein SufD